MEPPFDKPYRVTATRLAPSASYEKLCKHFEGLYLHAYDDGGGTWTIGWGHTKHVRAGMTANIDKAEIFFTLDTDEAVHALHRHVTAPLYQREFDALADFIFNEGETHFANSTTLRLLNLLKYEEAARALLMWDKMNHRTVKGLHLRREAELQLFTEGTLPF